MECLKQLICQKDLISGKPSAGVHITASSHAASSGKQFVVERHTSVLECPLISMNCNDLAIATSSCSQIKIPLKES